MRKTVLAIDGSNLRGQARSVNRIVDYPRLRQFLVTSRQDRSLVEAFVYLPITPNGNSDKVIAFHDRLRSLGFMVVTKVGAPRPNGSYKANMDTDLALDVMEFALTSRPDVVVLVSGDGDFAGLCERLRRRGIRVEVASLQGPLARSLSLAASSIIDLKPYFDQCRPSDNGRPRPDTEHN